MIRSRFSIIEHVTKRFAFAFLSASQGGELTLGVGTHLDVALTRADFFRLGDLPAEVKVTTVRERRSSPTSRVLSRAL